jgi:hypothetical protein
MERYLSNHSELQSKVSVRDPSLPCNVSGKMKVEVGIPSVSRLPHNPTWVEGVNLKPNPA